MFLLSTSLGLQKERMGVLSNMPYFSFSVLCILSANIFQADHIKTTGVFWRLDPLEDKVISIGSSQTAEHNISSSTSAIPFEQDIIFEALLSTNMKDGIWTKHQTLSFCTGNAALANGCVDIRFNMPSESNQITSRNESAAAEPEEPLDCGKSVNFTHYDHLVGVSSRRHHPHVPEPHASLVFRRRGESVDLDLLERKLRRSKREKPKSLQLYNQIGNFWRIKGDASKAIECYRRSLAVSPNNAEVLLSLARVLFNLQYLDDAIFLTRRSLEVQPPDQSAWLQHFTLGEILKEYGNYQEAEMHLRHTLELRPRFQPAEEALRQMEAAPGTRLHGYTVFIIFVLVACVLLSILSTLESAAAEPGSPEGARPGRAGMRALRGRWRRSV
ncbi:uncharacterized protein LOC119097080 isoform X1 [Pollicipes pollicipes]|uniref:uncharacterized protein LOC119097080 isoform X1 n=1 Tax=Pollicipes pollicipes TaxID=41117 RepID=UPI0018853444|nr:uncharacterized protein LOC119097080 isoform X1 [Pollicipes pollicipes]XP_037076007.1 uncharacterized protein LOC119097080 isoform X1 [Pollicipes pollicipes]XP_037076008.1 uncharacterized protein LOC119097080 isoform X1 [Pollicipes pollicipes]XP_037076009.1 uncharacterized protein LOC119097080 isoform X1 [Pollicipes pollicipes]XP_037076010.1 uncharacterized protein LOC119097080 isoform X1 [Pollicipes pollicipes]